MNSQRVQSLCKQVVLTASLCTLNIGNQYLKDYITHARFRNLSAGVISRRNRSALPRYHVFLMFLFNIWIRYQKSIRATQ